MSRHLCPGHNILEPCASRSPLVRIPRSLHRRPQLKHLQWSLYSLLHLAAPLCLSHVHTGQATTCRQGTAIGLCTRTHTFLAAAGMNSVQAIRRSAAGSQPGVLVNLPSAARAT
ncbi:hypothetical protein FA95DRAFT_947620 [Auriscalpium vulgare]|uniref:Uncharacterized protein n=1 Tax=Auriscalpium vulgare TaxID=40419 RepID=A0ACB8RYA4_9AGAM|nr:hypothetical protein FA95DRAFT_947620 [Auriscalpium vulgare]